MFHIPDLSLYRLGFAYAGLHHDFSVFAALWGYWLKSAKESPGIVDYDFCGVSATKGSAQSNKLSDGKQDGATRYYNTILDQPKNGGSYKPQPRATEQDRHYHSRHDHGYQAITACCVSRAASRKRPRVNSTQFIP